MSEYLSNSIMIEDGKIRIYWSACVKGCGIHELGDIGLLGCKTKVEGKAVPAVDIMIGGKLVAESKDAHTVLKAIPLDLAKYYVEELVLEYKRLKKANESFEKFNERVLSHYSYGALAFMMSYNYRYKEMPRLELEANAKAMKHEPFEIFHFGEKIYKMIEGENPYGIVKNFVPQGRSVKMRQKSEIAAIVNKMIASDERRAEVFTELLIDINAF